MKLGNRVLAIMLTICITIMPMSYGQEVKNNKLSKEETVYVSIDENGKVKEKLVSVHLHSEKEVIDVLDSTNLTDIENLKGDEKVELKDGKIHWKSKKADIYYQGKSNKELPIKTQISYKLNGKDIVSKDLESKSGNLEIKIKFENKDKRKVKINGINRELFMPYSVATMVAFDSDIISDIKSENAKIINANKKTIISNITFPGLSENIGSELEKLDIDYDKKIKNEFVINATVKNYKKSTISLVILNELPAFDEIKNANNANEIRDALDKLQTNGQKLLDGSIKLNDGLSKLNSNMPKMVEGTKKLQKGSNALSDGAKKLDVVFTDVLNGTQKLVDGSQRLKKGTADLNDGAKKLNEGISIFNQKASMLTQYENKVSDGVKQIDKLNQGTQLANKKYKEIQLGSNKIKNGTSVLSNGTEKLKLGVDKYREGSNKLTIGLKELSVKVNGLPKTFLELKNGISKLNKGAVKLNQSLNKLDLGLQKLNSNTVKLNSAAKQVNGASKQISSSGKNLSSGLKQTSALLKKQKSAIGSASNLQNNTNSSVTALKKHLKTKGDKEGLKLIASIEKNEKKQTQILSGMKQSSNIETLSVSIDKFSEAVLGISKSILDVSNNQLKIQEGYLTVQSSVSELNKGSKQLSVGIDTINKGVVKSSSSMTQLVNAIKQLEDGSSKLSAQLNNDGELYKGIVNLNLGAKRLRVGSNELNAGIDKFGNDAMQPISNGIFKLSSKISSIASPNNIALLRSIPNKINQLSNGSKALVNGSNVLSNAMGKLDKGSRDLSSGLNKIKKEGIVPLNSGLTELVKGVKVLNDKTYLLSDATLKLQKGSTDLSDGMKKYKNDGIDKMKSEVNKKINDFDNLIDVINALNNLSKQTHSFSGDNVDMDISTKYIFKIE